MILFRLFLLLDAVLMRLPHSWRRALFTSLARLARFFAPSRNRVIRQNLRFAFADTLTEEEINAIEYYCYRNLGLNLLQVMENRHYTTEDFTKRVRFENREQVDELLAQDRSIIFVSAHFGNWEMGATALSALISPTTSIYKAFKREEFDPYLLESRTPHGMDLAEKSGALKHLARALKNGNSVSLMIDQSSNSRHGVAVDFFSHPTYHSSTPAILSYKYNAPIVPLYIFTDDEENFTIRFENPIEVESDDAQGILKATQEQANTLEKVIRANPKFWFWCHKRWKSDYPEIYAG
ncbi:MAG: lipid A biosynthesis lauroyl acyltransferase [Sulfuricurvum sp.]|uniref:lipid A biosynthesis lauroyl acyltransferase n=1 Tax=Sulfuricurvum sp. TaxID=2025608 RepID=UPI002624B5E7|nr:lipid A biosynthesis lauroyl acyltransferase [Sulfuricurvum sp.]MDD2949668.1 lipid A biosynthesis lauroyl acyltransferase [Sulfuricurvum sp.]MDD5117294.1 lipid A biosynthesis lauroyl acyltransferase [Sulfuricurvum sp.]